MAGSRKVITAARPHALVCNHCSGLPVLKCVFVYDNDATRTQICFFAEPCAPYVYAVALAPDASQKESDLSPNGTAYTLNVVNDAAPAVSHQADFQANTMQDMFMIFVPAKGIVPAAGGYITEPAAYQLVNPPDPSTAEESSIRQASASGHFFQVSAPVTTGIVGLGILPDSGVQWIWGWNAGGNTPLTSRLVVATNFVQGLTHGIAIRDDAEVTEVIWFYYSDLPYVMFDVSEGFFYGAQSDGSFDIVDLTTPSTPTLVSHTAGICTTAQCLKRAGDLVWIGDSATGDLIGVDVSTPASPSVISTTPLGDTPEGLEVCGDGNFVYVSLLGGAVLCYDVSTPSAPVLNVTVIISDFTPSQKMLQMGYNHIYALGIQTSTGKPALAVLRA